ncbi:hypothetical protein K488DRAFT_24329, partial [Vararia minispora EC-137]
HYDIFFTTFVLHRDPSLGNFMMRQNGGGVPTGVLNDWDLALDENDPSPQAVLERMGTVPYMALDFLQKLGYGSVFRHLFRHDLEA